MIEQVCVACKRRLGKGQGISRLITDWKNHVVYCKDSKSCKDFVDIKSNQMLGQDLQINIGEE